MIFQIFVSGLPHLVVIGVVALAIVGSIMAVNWAKLIYPECESNIMVLGVLITFHIIGLLSVWYLIYSRINQWQDDENLSTGNTFLKIKLISLYIFGLGYMFHCGYFIWKHTFPNDCRDEVLSRRIKDMGIAYNSISIAYTLFLFLYFGMFYVRRRDNTIEENAASLGILLANSFIWLDTLFSESDSLFKNHFDENNSTMSLNLTESSNRAMEAIEKTDPFLSPAMIEFSLLAIDMLFTKTDDESSGSSNTKVSSNNDSSGSSSTKGSSDDDASGSSNTEASPNDGPSSSSDTKASSNDDSNVSLNTKASSNDDSSGSSSTKGLSDDDPPSGSSNTEASSNDGPSSSSNTIASSNVSLNTKAASNDSSGSQNSNTITKDDSSTTSTSKTLSIADLTGPSDTITPLNDDSSGSNNSKSIPKTDLSISSNKKSALNDGIKSNLTKRCVRFLFQLIFSLGSFILFALAFTVVLTTDSSKDFLTTPNDFYAYVSVQLSVKVVIFILILICLFVEWHRLTFQFNVWAFVLMIACFGNIVYHMFYCFALHYESSRNHTNQVPNIKSVFVDVAWADNIIGIIVGSLQTLFILGFHSREKHEQDEKGFLKKCVYYFCSLLGILNLGLWVSDSIGEGRFPVFSIIIYRTYEEDVWSFINKIILPLTIFFRFHSALDFFEFYWRPKTILENIK